MRLAVISDVHGNLLALEAVLADIKARGADRTVNLGDCCAGPLWPRGTLELLQSLALPTVRGNHDRWAQSLPVEKFTPAGRFARDTLTEGQRNWLGALPPSLDLGDGVLAVHGTKASDTEYLVEDLVDGRLALATPATLAARLTGVDADLVLCGHSHNAHVAYAPGGRMVVNPGSVGCPLFADGPTASRTNARAPHARYALLTRGRGGRWSADLIALEYDWDKAAARAIETGHPSWAPVYTHGAVA